MQRYRQVDGGWAWICLAACLFSNILNGILFYGSSVIFVALLNEYGDSVASTALVGSLFQSVMSCTGPFAAVLVKLTSCRTTMIIGGLFTFLGNTSNYFVRHINIYFFTYGVLTGIGSGLVAASSFMNVGFSFNRYQGFTCGIAVAGNGFGMFLSGPVVQAIIDTYGLRGGFLMLAAICSHEIVFGMLLRPSQLETMQRHPKQKRNFDGKEIVREDYLLSKNSDDKNSILKIVLGILSVMKNKSFLGILIASIVASFSTASMLLHLPNYAIQKGATESEGALLMTLVGLGGTTSRLLTGLVVGKENGIDVLQLQFGLTAINGILTVMFPFFSSTSLGRRFYSVVFGLYSGGLVTLFTPISVELLGISQLPAGIGAFMMSCGLGSIVGPPIIGFIVDTWDTYEISFYLAGVCLLLSSFIVLISSTWRKRFDDESKHRTEHDLTIKT